ncbi:MAG TPA: energy transducer TonB [Thermoanaerobaculia bacterium]
MKALAALCFVLFVCTPVVSAEQRSFSARSNLYELTVTVDALPEAEDAFQVRVTDLTTNAEVMNAHATSKQGASVEMKSETDGTRFTVGLRLFLDSLGATLTAERNGAVVDTLRHGWESADPSVKHLNAPGALPIGGDVKAPVIIKRVEPIYPKAAREAKITGIVILEVLIDKTGAVTDAVVMQDLSGLGDAAIDAVRQWKFQPATKNGEPVDVIFHLTMSFKLR